MVYESFAMGTFVFLPWFLLSPAACGLGGGIALVWAVVMDRTLDLRLVSLSDWRPSPAFGLWTFGHFIGGNLRKVRKRKMHAHNTTLLRMIIRDSQYRSERQTFRQTVLFLPQYCTSTCTRDRTAAVSFLRPHAHMYSYQSSDRSCS